MLSSISENCNRNNHFLLTYQKRSTNQQINKRSIFLVVSVELGFYDLE
jgi:hypothetical protein